jgi:hypothetical protein
MKTNSVTSVVAGVAAEISLLKTSFAQSTSPSFKIRRTELQFQRRSRRPSVNREGRWQLLILGIKSRLIKMAGLPNSTIFEANGTDVTALQILSRFFPDATTLI